MSKIRFTSAFAIFSIIIALIHFIFETLYTLKYGQTWIGLLPDYLVITLLCVGGFFTVKNTKLVGILCGAWGYTFCIMYRAFIWRMEAIWADELPNYETLQVKVLILALIVSFPAFIVSFVKSFPQKNPN